MGMKLLIGSLIVLRIFVHYYNDALLDIYSNFSVYFPFLNVSVYLDMAKFVVIPVLFKTGDKSQGTSTLFTKDELKKYNGKDTDLLYLAILGNVFDVSSGASYYGVDKVYHAFTGRDGSRAFISGEFTEEGLTDHVLDLPGVDLLGLQDWVKMYESKYVYKGKLIGRYYNDVGESTEYRKQLEDKIQEALASKAVDKEEKQQFPSCNVEWTSEKGSRVWCSTNSGGVKRSWIGVPRKLYVPGSKSYRCACVNVTPRSEIVEEDSNYKKYFTEYDGCDSDSYSCYVRM